MDNLLTAKPRTHTRVAKTLSKYRLNTLRRGSMSTTDTKKSNGSDGSTNFRIVEFNQTLVTREDVRDAVQALWQAFGTNEFNGRKTRITIEAS